MSADVPFLPAARAEDTWLAWLAALVFHAPPARSERGPREPERKAPMRFVPANPELSRLQTTILCMDDDEGALRARSALLESEGYRVFAATTAEAAKRWFVAEEIDLVVSACKLHGVSGTELSIFMKQLRADVCAILLLDKVQPPSAILEQVDGCAQRNGAADDLLVCVSRVLEERAAVELKSA